MEQDTTQLDNACELKLLNQGNTAEIFLYDETKILKLFRTDFPPEAIRSEFDVAKRISDNLVFAPKVFGLAGYQNRCGILYEKINGKDMIADMMRKPYKVKSYSKALADLHAEIHRAPLDLHSDIKDKLSFQINAAAELTEREKEKIVSYMKALPHGTALCHFDFHPGNVMIGNNGFYVIDWMTACNGNAAADVARTYLLQRYGELLYANFFVKLIAHIAQKKIGRVYLRQYKKITGIADAEIKGWFLPLAAARLTEWISKNEKKKLLKFIRRELSKIN